MIVYVLLKGLNNKEIIYDSRDTAGVASQKQHSENFKKDRMLRHMLRNVILGSESARLQENITLETIQSGTVTTPSLVEKFLQCLAAGSDIRSWKSRAKKRCIHSTADDLMFAMSHGRKISNKHLKLGLAMKSLTESSQVIQMLSHYGHCTNYHMVEELETELTCNAIDER